MNDKYKEFFLPVSQTNKPLKDNWRTEWMEMQTKQTIQTWIDSTTKELFQNPVVIDDVTQYFGDDKMLMKDLMLNIRKTMEKGLYSIMGYGDSIYFHKTDDSPIYNYVYEQFKVTGKINIENVIIAYYSCGNLEITLGQTIDVKSIPEIDQYLNATVTKTILGRLGVSMEIDDKAIQTLLEENDNLPFKVADKDTYMDLFIDGTKLQLFNVKEYESDNNDNITLHFETELNPEAFYTYKYTFGSEEKGYRIESVTTLNKKSEISKVTLLDFQDHTNIDFSKLEDMENVVLLSYFAFGEYFGFVINPNSKSKMYTWIELKWKIGHFNKPKEEK